ncbi:MAG: FAD/NAD(P)-binding protein [Bacteroidetes bacterium]|nr:FAD/NAD(P)-binding protein [Bacteroidota bacterium]
MECSYLKHKCFSNEPDHFFDWCKSENQVKIPKDELPGKFLSRNLYGKYLDEIFKDALEQKSALINFEIIREEVIDIEKSGEQYVVHSNSGKKITANKVALATEITLRSPSFSK